jgi:mono/diheme cytochrome c family protein
MRLPVFFLLLVTVAACGKGDKPPPPSSGALLAQESGPGQSHGQGNQMKAPIRHDGPQDAPTVYKNQCAMCHGNGGRGDGISAPALKVKPRDYTDAAWQASVTDDDIKNIIVQGGKALGKSEAMAPYPDLAKQPEVLNGLVQIIRGFGKK